MPVTHILKNLAGNRWCLSTPDGVLVDELTAPSQAEAELAVQHLVPRDGTWQSRSHGQFIYRTPGRIEVSRRVHRY